MSGREQLYGLGMAALFLGLVLAWFQETWGGLASLLGWILLILLKMGLIRTGLKVLDGGKPEVNDFSSSPLQFLHFLGATILCGLMVIAGLIVFIIPGIILAVRFQLYSYLLIERDLRPVAALKQSWAMTKGKTGSLFLFGLAGMGATLLGMLAFFIGLFAAIPVVLVAKAFVYRKLSGDAPEVLAPGAASASGVA